MPDGYVLDIRMLITNLLDRIFQSMWKSLLISFEIGPTSIKLMFAIVVLLSLVNGCDILPTLQKKKNLQVTASCRR